MSRSITIECVRKTFRRSAHGNGLTVFEGIDLHIPAGQLVALVGPSGCGKSTLLNMIAGLDTPTAGAIRFGDGRSRAVPELSVVFQQPRLIDWLRVEENISIAFDRVREVSREEPDPATREATTHDLLAKVGLLGHRRSYPQFLSGGQKQRVAIARAFAVHPDVLLLDEPFSALDELTARKLRELLQEMWVGEEERRPTGVLVTHNMLEAAFLCDRIYVIGRQSGGIVATIDVDVPRPRNPDDPALFEVHRAIMQALE
ncbi:ABC transporter ATP-binding protein [Paraburkholderia lycopersici]|uniref:NitT/TauT family transport system ATP-binding protein n=1 Tax=Paraburkholderia lycopersici TaxID=416944 RepID=A0A1G7BHE9_9BURK|nr:ABC transporter ATP-binding protein [Paraburkholderia lycopersici]SDE26541.1 NitT/TauT family transport system ATP-binding protein [Paraburkholderia lycopersici]